MFSELGQHRILVRGLHHVDEVHDHDAAQVAQAQLARNRARRLQVGLENGFVKIARADKAARVHVDGGQRLGLVDDEVAARFQIHPPAQRAGDFLVDGIQVKNGPLALVVLQLGRRCGHELLTKSAQALELLHRIEADALGVVAHQIAQHALQQIQVLQQQ